MIRPWRFFDVRVARLRTLSPSFLRVTLHGEDLKVFADNGFDQRFKMIFPLPEVGLTHLPTGPDWYEHWRALPREHRNPVRTYTVRAVRQDLSEVDIDMVMHPGGDGPAITWARQAEVGGPLALLGPDARHDGPHGGVDFRLPPQTGVVLIAADETAVPAVASILERLPRHLTGEVILEVPHAEDFLVLDAPPGVYVNWCAREGSTHGSQLTAGFAAAAERLLAQRTGQQAPDVDIDILWEVPDQAVPDRDCYAWLAGEAEVIRSLRRTLIEDFDMDRRSVAFMGYWRLGRSEG